MFVWLLVNYLPGFSTFLLTFIVNHSQMSVHETLVALVPSFSSRHSTPQFLPAQRSAIILALSSSGMLTHYSADFGKWMDFLPSLLSCCQYITFSRRLSVPMAEEKQWENRTRGGSVCVDNEISAWLGLGFSPDFRRGRRASWRVRGWGLYLLCLVCACRFLRAMIYPPEPYFFFLFSIPPRCSVVNAVLSVRPPCTSLHSCRARRPCSSPFHCPANSQLHNSLRMFSPSRFSLLPNSTSLFFSFFLCVFYASIIHASPFSNMREHLIFIIHCSVSVICASP